MFCTYNIISKRFLDISWDIVIHCKKEMVIIQISQVQWLLDSMIGQVYHNLYSRIVPNSKVS